MKIGVVIPWKETPSRIKPLEKVLEWYKENLPEAEIIFANASDEVWLPSATRNLGVRKAQEAGCDVIVMCDADTIPIQMSLKEAIQGAYQDDLIHMPYNGVARYLDKEATELYFNGRPLGLCPSFEYTEANGGIWVFRPEAWWSIGGMDEKFVQWGIEDGALLYAHKFIKKSDYVWHDGHIYCLGHDHQDQDPNFYMSHSRNSDVYRHYFNIDNPEDLLTWIKKPMPKRL